MNDEETIEVFETQIKVLQAKIDAIKDREAVWIPKEGEWSLGPNLNPYFFKPYFHGRAAGAGAAYATREDALAAVPLRYNQQMLEAYKREFDPTFKPKFNGAQKNYSLAYTKRDRTKVEWVVKYNKWHGDPQLTYFSKEACQILCEKVNNGTVVLELGT